MDREQPPARLPSLRIFAEYRCFPTWVFLPGGGEDNPDPASLGLSPGLVADLAEWSDEFDAIFPDDDPGSAAFPSPQAEVQFRSRGLVLARRAAAELHDRYEVTYSDVMGHVRSGQTDRTH